MQRLLQVFYYFDKYILANIHSCGSFKAGCEDSDIERSFKKVILICHALLYIESD